jgi:hypothetical protein
VDGGVGGLIRVFLTSALVGGQRSASRSYRFTPGESAPSTSCVGGWVGPRYGEEKILEPTGTRTTTLGSSAPRQFMTIWFDISPLSASLTLPILSLEMWLLATAFVSSVTVYTEGTATLGRGVQ